MKFSSKVLRCQQSPMRKFHPYSVAAAAAGKKIYHLNIGQPDIETPKALFEAVRNFHEPVLAYSESPGKPVLIDAICRYYKRIGVTFDPSDVLITTGGSEALFFTAMTLLDDGDEIIIPEPFYSNYNTFITSAGAAIRPLETSPEDGYFYADRDKLEALINPRTRAILITNPGNPTGTVLTRPQMQMILDVAKKHDIFLVVDEVYREFVYSGEPLSSFAQLPGADEHLILIDSVSKRFSACGARIGCMLSTNKEFIAQALKYCQGRLCVATLDQIAAAALYTVDPSYFDAVREEYHRRRDTVVKKLHEIPGVVCECPKGAFYLMAALPVDDAEKFQQWLLEKFDDHGDTVMFSAGRGFYQTPGKGINEIRIAYVLKQQDLERAMDLLALGIQRYNEEQGK
jgi:aspartate aminotransferase